MSESKHLEGKLDTDGLMFCKVLGDGKALYIGEITCDVIANIDMALATATELVRRWNSHDALLETCWEIVNFCESKDRLNDDGVCPTKAYEKAKAAIALAEKEE